MLKLCTAVTLSIGLLSSCASTHHFDVSSDAYQDLSCLKVKDDNLVIYDLDRPGICQDERNKRRKAYEERTKYNLFAKLYGPPDYLSENYITKPRKPYWQLKSKSWVTRRYKNEKYYYRPIVIYPGADKINEKPCDDSGKSTVYYLPVNAATKFYVKKLRYHEDYLHNFQIIEAKGDIKLPNYNASDVEFAINIKLNTNNIDEEIRRSLNNFFTQCSQ